MTELVLPSLIVFASLAILTGVALNYALTRVSPTRRRLVELADGGRGAGVVVTGPSLTGMPGVEVGRSRTFIPKSAEQMGRLQKRLAKAGFHGGKAVAVYAAAEVILAALGVGSMLLVFGRSGLIMAAALGFMGYMLPNLFLERRVFSKGPLRRGPDLGMNRGGIFGFHSRCRLFLARILATEQQQRHERQGGNVFGPDKRQGRGHRGLLFLGADSLCCLPLNFEGAGRFR